MDALFFNRMLNNNGVLMMPSSIPVVLFDKPTTEAVSFRESVSQDLRKLFNVCASNDAKSLPLLLAQGVPEWCGNNVEDERVLVWFCRQLRRTLLCLEPRIKALTISVQETQQSVLALRLDAVLWQGNERLALDLSYQNGHWC